MEELFVLVAVIFILCCFFGKPMKLFTRGILGLLGGLILVGLAIVGISIILSIIAVATLCAIGIYRWLLIRSRRR